MICKKCNKEIKKIREIRVKQILESGLRAGKTIFNRSHSEQKVENRIAKLQEAFFQLEYTINRILKVL